MSHNISDLNLKDAISVLREMGDGETSEELRFILDEQPTLADVAVKDLPDSNRLNKASWRGTEHTYGFIEQGDSDFLAIKYASSIEPDTSLKGQPINIKLGSLYTMNYPGWGRHNVLMHFQCQHALENSTETAAIEFEQKFKSKEGEGAGNIGDFIFIGLRAPENGLQFKVQTINVSNEMDEAALGVLESDFVQNGLQLINSSFATLLPFSQIANGLKELLLNRNRNKIVQDFTIGFDFDEYGVDVAKLRRGTYVVAQAKKNDIRWEDWVYERNTGLIVHRQDSSQRLHVNHLSFNISEYEETK